jgi:hypothetical protein
MYDYGGLDIDRFEVVASFPVVGLAAGENLAKRFRPLGEGVWELTLDSPMTLAGGTLTVSVKDRQGNTTRIERTFTATRADAN